MKIFLTAASLALLLFASCTQRGADTGSPAGSGYGPAAILPAQVFTIFPGRDTAIFTKDSLRFFFPAAAFSTDAASVLVEIREAIRLSDILRARLTTRTGSDILQSAGMFYIEAKAGGNPVNLQKRVGVTLPTYKYRSDMLLYRGEPKEDGINWTDPQPLLTEAEMTLAETGKNIFRNNCSNCHSIDKDGAGPALAYITERRCYTWLKDFVRNSQAMNDPVSRCVKKPWNNSVMPAYGNTFSDKAFDTLYGYIAAESKKYPRAAYFSKDRCREVSVKDTIAVRDVTTVTTKSSRGFAEALQNSDTAAPDADTSTSLPSLPAEAAEYPRNNAFYQFMIDGTGWYNIDVLLETEGNVQPGSLKLEIQGSFKTRIEAYLVIPGRKILLQGHTADNRFFYFKDPDFSLPLPVGEQGVVYLMGEEGEKALWASTLITFSARQTIVLTPVGVPDVYKELEKLRIDGMEYAVRFTRTERRYDIRETLYTNDCREEKARTVPADSVQAPMEGRLKLAAMAP